MSGCERCGAPDHCACYHDACCTCGSKDHASCGQHPPVNSSAEHGDHCATCNAADPGEPLASDFAHMPCGGWCVGECPGCCACGTAGCSGCELDEPAPAALEFDTSPETLQRLRDALRGGPDQL